MAGLLVHAGRAAEVPPGLRERVGRMVRQEQRLQGRKDDALWRSSTMWLAAAVAGFALLAGTLWRQVGESRSYAEAAQLAATRAKASRDSLLADVSSPRLHLVSLAAPDGGQPVARVFWNHDRQHFVVAAFRLPPAPDGRTYQLWAIAAGTGPVSMGTFNTDSSGVATVILPVGKEIEALGLIASCGITQEPSGGSAAPTETPRYAGDWVHTD